MAFPSLEGAILVNGFNRRRKMALILYIEDDAVITRIVQSALSREGFEVVTAETGQDGVELADNLLPDLILVDFWLPAGLDGWETIRLIKENPALTSIPMIAVTAQTNPLSRKEALEAGCVDYITKPFDLQQLIQSIKRALL
jgi:two-component system, cell cycle response regulator DivK